MPDHSKKLFEMLVRENEGALMAYIRTFVRDPELADDIFQETLLTGWSKIDEFDQSRPLKPWLRGIALNQCRNAWRSKSRDVLVFSDGMAEMVESTIRSIDQGTGDEWRDKSEVMRDCVNHLAPKSRDLIRRRYEENQNAVRIAKETSTTATAIRKQLQRVRKTLADCFGRKIVGATGS